MKKKKSNPVFLKFKKKISSFLVGEEGRISKQSLLKAGILVGTLGVAIPSASAVDSLSLGSYSGGSATATHSSHSSHGSHESHNSW